MDTGGVLSALLGPSNLQTLGTAAVYAVVLGFVFIECGLLVGFFLPGDTLLFAAGIAAHSSTGVDIGWLMTGVVVAAAAGECLGYLIGARAGLTLLHRRDGRVLNPRNIVRAERFTAHYGVFTIIAARWIPWVRTFAPVLAGATRMPWPKFMLANVAGAVCWGPVLVLVGYLAASVPALRHISLALAVAVVVAALVAGLVRYRLTVRRRTPDREPDRGPHGERDGEPVCGPDGEPRGGADGAPDGEPTHHRGSGRSEGAEQHPLDSRDR